MKAENITVDFLRDKYKVKTDKALADEIGRPAKTIASWKKRGIPKKEKLEILQEILQNDGVLQNEGIVGDNNVQIVSKDTIQMNTSKSELQELYVLIEHYAPPALIIEIKNKLLKIKKDIQDN